VVFLRLVARSLALLVDVVWVRASLHRNRRILQSALTLTLTLGLTLTRGVRVNPNWNGVHRVNAYPAMCGQGLRVKG